MCAYPSSKRESRVTRVTRIKGVLFDKDGTLIDFHATWIPAYEQAATRICANTHLQGRSQELLIAGGYDPATGRCAAESPLACGSTQEIASVWGATLGLTDAGAIVAELEHTFAEFAASRAVPVTDLSALFERLIDRQIVLGLATMDSEALAGITLSQLRVLHYMSFVCGYDSGHGEKPDPGMVEAFCEYTGLAPESVALVGDTPHDLNMGRAAGVGLVVGVLTGASSPESLTCLADHVLPDITHLEAVLD